MAYDVSRTHPFVFPPILLILFLNNKGNYNHGFKNKWTVNNFIFNFYVICGKETKKKKKNTQPQGSLRRNEMHGLGPVWHETYGLVGSNMVIGGPVNKYRLIRPNLTASLYKHIYYDKTSQISRYARNIVVRVCCESTKFPYSSMDGLVGTY